MSRSDLRVAIAGLGWGEAFGHRIFHATRAAIDTLLGPMCVGRDPRDITALTDGLQRVLHGVGRNGPTLYALSGIDIALWDLAGKAAGQPLYRLLARRKQRQEQIDITNVSGGLKPEVLQVDPLLLKVPEGHPRVTFISVLSAFCEARGCRSFTSDGVKQEIMAYDDHHFTPTASNHFGSILGPRILDAVQTK